MEAILKFDLNDPHQRLEHKRAINATNAYIVLNSTMTDVFRKLIKYEGDKYSEETINVVYKLRDSIFDLMTEYGVDLNDLE